jgi:SWI/SNF-related matrix-associated actin-dependent regulator of chromatin subfamily A member 5
MDRVHRIGQTKPVLIYRLLCENTIEEKILERQAMRLKLDSLVIQQGRVLKVGEHFTKDQMKEMIQYGADAIFRAGDDFKDEEIDLILKRGEEQTNKFFEEAEKQAKSKSNLLLNFSFDPNDLYKFENEDYRLKRKENAEKALSNAYALELEKENKLLNSKRDHGHVNYNVDQQQAQLFGSKNQKKKNKIPKIPIYHLYKNRDRIIQLKQKQINYFIQNNKKIPEKIDEDPNISDGLNPQEYKELKSLLDTGFPNWERKEYEAFLASLDFIPKDDIEKIAKEIPTKTFEEVKAYCETFWGRIDEFTDGQRIMKNIEKKERMEKQRQQSSMLIAKKCQGIEDGEYEEIKIAFPTNNHQSEYTYEEDQYLIYITYKYGYGNWDEIMKKIKTSEDLLFNYFLKSRNKIEIQKRIDYLVKIIEKEYNPNTTNEKGSWKKNKENKEKLEEDNSIMVSNFSKVSSTNKKFKKNGKDKIKGVNTNSKFEDSSNKNLGNNIQLDEDEEEENDENNFEKEKSNNNSNKKVKIEDSSNNVAKVIEDNEAEKGKKDLEEDIEME